jgi:hypothetical protein
MGPMGEISIEKSGCNPYFTFQEAAAKSYDSARISKAMAGLGLFK